MNHRETVRALYREPSRPSIPALRTCARCGRRGSTNFVLVDRYADGSEQWRCRAIRECLKRVKHNEAAKLTAIAPARRTAARTHRSPRPSSNARKRLWIADAREGVWHTLDVLGDRLYRSECGWEADGRSGIVWPDDPHGRIPADARACESCLRREWERSPTAMDE